MNRLALGLMKRVQLFDVVPFSFSEEMTSSWLRVLGTNFFHRVVGFGCFPYGSSINKDPSYTMFDSMDAGHVLLSFGFELARGPQFYM